ncbi:hypothetical protein M422DRAFT_264537 [Sphaerobolus stellatus SS14]|uniref:Integrase core domain-containing protein n=1 Tax=Sphaerobolus stellatus (strain SS14) TaxID=990650 RepID=A0A0C9TT55_SPHS4|nr:hypothetical protein M422DRAFT_264537 [Sphaerobolus stellatus SS14]
MGPGRGSFMWGSSTHNTRIKRLWVEVATQFARRWRAFFFHLERLHGLNRHNPHHIWLIGERFLAEINDDCDLFCENWNTHPISTCGNMSPQDIRFYSISKYGKDIREFDGVHPETFNRYLGVEGDVILRLPGQTGAGHSEDESEWDNEEDNSHDISLEEKEDCDLDEFEGSELFERIQQEQFRILRDRIAANLRKNVNHKPVKPPRSQIPFTSEESLAAFQYYLDEVQKRGLFA